MAERSRLSQKSLFDFLASTRLPLVSSLVAVVRWLGAALGIGCAVYAAIALLLSDDGLWEPARPWSGALPALVAVPAFGFAWHFARRERVQRAAVALFVGVFALSVLAVWPRGAFHPAWYAQPFLALLATTCLGIVPGLLSTMFAVTALLASALLVVDPAFAGLFGPEAWAHTASLAAVTLASALAGALLHSLLLAALIAADDQRRKNYEWGRALRHRERLLRHALRVETVGDLAGMVSHQLRNVFQVLMGHVSLAAEGGPDEMRRRLDSIGDAIDTARPLLDELLVLAHPEEGRAEAADLGELAERFFERARPVLPAAIALRLERDTAPLPVLLNPRGLDHALWNLVINARQAIPEEGTIVLRTGGAGDSAWVEVADDGCGIPAEIRERIFDPYFTTKPPGKGTGLGLAAVARFARGCNGSVAVDSDLGRGSAFRLEFPLAPATAAATADPAARSA